jgi:uncharacterized protein (DUF1800 family)
MRRLEPTRSWIFAAALLVLTAQSAAGAIDLPWRESGFTEREAAAHLIDRLTFGARPGDIDETVAMGLDRWVEHQLAAELKETSLDGYLEGLDSLDLPVREYPAVYPNPGQVIRQAQDAGIVPEGQDPRQIQDDRERRQFRRDIFRWAQQEGIRFQRELLGEMMVQKLMRATYSENQLSELLTDFWFNHFNVSITDNQARVYVLAYERDAIRPNVLGDFDVMLESTAKHPAMLMYLDNAQSTAGDGDPTTMDEFRTAMQRRGGRRGARGRPSVGGDSGVGRNRPQGLNENYARELLELHTLGVDGGYDQSDVTEVARAFTGWTVYPPEFLLERVGDRLDRALRSGAGFVAEDGFLFRADAHDAGKKSILGARFPAGRGVEDGEEVLSMVATHRSTAEHLATKLAARFVSDDPPQSLVDRLSSVFLRTDGDLMQTMIALVESPEFWNPDVRGQKIKSPFELAVSALRALDADIDQPRATVEWIAQMGQPLYAYQAPTGYPDRAEFWVNTGALLNRMNFGLALAAGEVQGVEIDLLAINDFEEPASRLDALETYVPLLLPERDPAATVALLEPMVLEPTLGKRVEQAVPEAPEQPDVFDEEMGLFAEEELFAEVSPQPSRQSLSAGLEQVVGVILGSPEFQRK